MKDDDSPPGVELHGLARRYYDGSITDDQRCSDVRHIASVLLEEVEESRLENIITGELCRKVNSFTELMKTLKSIASKKINNKSIGSLNGGVIFDTCYDENKAEKLVKALDALKSKFEGADFKKLLVLLIASYAMASKDPRNFFYDSEWFYLLVRAAAKKFAGDDVYISVCPSLGDAIALYYYYVINFENADPVDIGKNDVIKIVSTLLDTRSDASNTGGQGTG